MRIDLRADLDGSRLALQIDIGFGDAVTPDSSGLAKRFFTVPWSTLPPIGCAELSKRVRENTEVAV